VEIVMSIEDKVVNLTGDWSCVSRAMDILHFGLICSEFDKIKDCLECIEILYDAKNEVSHHDHDIVRELFEVKEELEIAIEKTREEIFNGEIS
jgi:hypothetical protein